MNTNIHSINLPKIVQIGWGHHVDFCVWKNRPLLLAKGVCLNVDTLCAWGNTATSFTVVMQRCMFGNTKIYLLLLSFLNTDMALPVEIFHRGRQAPVFQAKSILLLLMAWRRKEPGHQQQWHGLVPPETAGFSGLEGSAGCLCPFFI